MNRKDFLTAFDVWVRHGDLTVETTGTQKRGVEHVAAVGGGDDYDAFVGLEAIHFDKKLVQGLLALVIAAAIALATGATDGVDLVDENDAGRIFLGLLKHVTDAACTHTDKHFHKIRSGDGEERHASFACDGAGKKGFTSAGRTNEQRAFWNFSAQAGEFLWIAEELDDFLQLFLGFVDTCNVIECDAALLFGEQFSPRLAKAHRTAFAAPLHPVHEINPDANEQKEGQQRQNERLKARLLLALGGNLNTFVDQEIGHRCVRGHDGGVIFPVGAPEGDTLAVDCGAADFLFLYRTDEIRIADFAAVHRGALAIKLAEKRDHQ